MTKLQEFIETIKEFYQVLLDYVDNESVNDKESLFAELSKKIQIINQRNSPNDLKMILSLILHIANNHYRNPSFVERIEEVLSYLKAQIEQTLSNSEIFKIFSKNKLILNILFKNDLIKIDQSILNFLMSRKDYRLYFYFEIKPFLKEEQVKSIEQELLSINSDIFYMFNENSKLYDNDSYICSLIRNNQIDEFITYCNQTATSLFSKVKPSIFETNDYLLTNEDVSLIEYAAFYGSIEIIHFLRLNNVKLTPSLWLYGIHSNSAELIHLLEENRVYPHSNYIYCLFESIKCHHNEIANYIIINKIDGKINEEKYYECVLHYHNFSFFPDDLNQNSIFLNLFQFGYNNIVELYIEMKKDKFEAKTKVSFFICFLITF